MGRWAALGVLCTSISLAGDGWDELIMMRGDANHDSSVNIGDATMIMNYLYASGEAPPCLNEADANADGTVNISDMNYILNFLFSSGPPPSAPGVGTQCEFEDFPYVGCSIDPCNN